MLALFAGLSLLGLRRRWRTEAPELRHLPAATYEWYSKNYLDRDYPLRFILMCNGVEFPDTPEEDK